MISDHLKFEIGKVIVIEHNDPALPVSPSKRLEINTKLLKESCYVHLFLHTRVRSIS